MVLIGPYKCDCCSGTYRSKGSLRHHKYVVHTYYEAKRTRRRLVTKSYKDQFRDSHIIIGERNYQLIKVVQHLPPQQLSKTYHLSQATKKVIMKKISLSLLLYNSHISIIKVINQKIHLPLYLCNWVICSNMYI